CRTRSLETPSFSPISVKVRAGSPSRPKRSTRTARSQSRRRLRPLRTSFRLSLRMNDCSGSCERVSAIESDMGVSLSRPPGVAQVAQLLQPLRRDPDEGGVTPEGPTDRFAHPPDGEDGEADPTRGVETARSFDEPQIPFADEVCQ